MTNNATSPRTAATLVATLARDFVPLLAALIEQADAAEASFRKNASVRDGFASGDERDEAQDALASLPYFLRQAMNQLGRVHVTVAPK